MYEAEKQALSYIPIPQLFSHILLLILLAKDINPKLRYIHSVYVI
jgi:hypothetical protein